MCWNHWRENSKDRSGHSTVFQLFYSSPPSFWEEVWTLEASVSTCVFVLWLCLDTGITLCFYFSQVLSNIQNAVSVHFCLPIIHIAVLPGGRGCGHLNWNCQADLLDAAKWCFKDPYMRFRLPLFSSTFFFQIFPWLPVWLSEASNSCVGCIPPTITLCGWFVSLWCCAFFNWPLLSCQDWVFYSQLVHVDSMDFLKSWILIFETNHTI